MKTPSSLKGMAGFSALLNSAKLSAASTESTWGRNSRSSSGRAHAVGSNAEMVWTYNFYLTTVLIRPFFLRMLPIRLVQSCSLWLVLSWYVLYLGVYSMSQALECSRTRSPSLRALYLSILHTTLDLRWISHLLQ
jgi:hypothetical protein